jgi:hypothetical protein
MPKTVITAQFSGDDSYEMDIGNLIDASSRFILPPDLDFAQAATILDAIGAKPLSSIVDGFCNDATNGKLRKLVFVRDDGSSMSVPIGRKDDIFTAGNVIKGVLNAGTVKVSCIKLVGETWRTLSDELGLSYTAGQVATSHKANGGATKQHYYSGTMQYAPDSLVASGQQILTPVKSISDIQNSPATQVAAVWDGCVGTLSNSPGCGGNGNKRKHRRYILDFVTEVDGNTIVATESIELPAKSRDASAIKTCGQAAAQLTGILCIGYRGESYDKFHKVL